MAAYTVENIDAYCQYLGKRLKVHILKFEPEFKPVSDQKILLYSEFEKILTGKEIREVSRLIANLEALWKDDPQEFYLLVGKNVRARREKLRDQWVDLTAEWLRFPRLL